MSSLMDAWLLLQDFEGNGERNRVLYVLKARGMAHSKQVRASGSRTPASSSAEAGTTRGLIRPSTTHFRD